VTSTLPPVTETRRTIDSDLSTVETPRVRTVFRRLLFWLGALVILAVIIFVIFAAAAPTQSTGELDATNTQPLGARALLQVLRQDGVTVDAPIDLADAIGDADPSSGPTTLVLYDPQSILDAAQLKRMVGLADHVVLIEPSTGILQVLAPHVLQAGFVASTAPADCDLPAARRAGTVTGLDKGYRISGTTDATGCFGSGGIHGLVVDQTAGRTVTVVGGPTTFTNGTITQKGNAALALGIFGQTAHTVWYLPSLSDYPSSQADGVIPNPPWVLLVEVLGAIVVIAAAIWRGRRFGPIVVERLPVVVRASETVEGRARLYQRASSRTHALDYLRIGALGRLAALCGLPKRASLDDVVGAVARTTGRPLPELRALLVDDIPDSDADLLRMSDDLRQLERDVARTTRPA
jgi:hypothetical protein